MPTLEELKQSLDVFNEKYPRPSMRPLELSALYSLESDWPHKSWPGSTRPGVYALMFDQQEVAYIGKASCGRDLGRRLGDYYCYGPGRICLPKDPKAMNTKYVVTIEFPDDRAFEAAACEEYLIGKLNPPFNSNGLSKSHTR